MGHVDHGKTTLLDTLRKTRVAAKESGGITQKIGAYKLTFNKNEVVFIDTPGHEAFTNIRARGAEVTDIVILVVAADDGVKPQTIEAINHAKSADVPMIVAINKIDKDGADPNKVKQELTKYDVLVEDWGGDIVCVEISAKENKNLESLLEMVVLVSEMQELKAYDTIPASGVILESRLDPQLGPIGTVLIQHGIVKKGDHFICGNSVGKVKTLFDDWGKPQSRSQVLAPVEIMGFGDVPEAGDRFQVVDDIERAKKVIDIRKLEEKEEKKDGAPNDGKFSIQNFFNQLEANKVKVFPLIVKSDNYGSGEVLESVLMKQSQEKLRVNIVAKGIGNINDSDILLAATAEAIVIGFNVKVSQNTLSLAKKKGVEIKLYNVIYHLIEDMEKAIKGEIEPEYVESWIGSVEVLQKFKISRIGVIAGCLVKEGKVTNKSKLKVMRNEDLVFEGEIETLKRIKDEVAEVKAGTECGIRVKNFNDIMVGDILQAYELTIKE
jgi:translation initiation factor IF-2